MDLRRRLMLYLSAFFVLLLAAGVLFTSVALREDVREEVAASGRLVDLLLSVSQSADADFEALAERAYRHLAVSVERSGNERSLQNGTPDLAQRLSRQLGQALVEAQPERRIEAGGQVLVIRADPGSEIAEILHASFRYLGTMVVFSVLTLCAVWYAVGRALSPVRALEARLEELGEGRLDGVAAEFELPEFNRISRAIDRLAFDLRRAEHGERDLARKLITVQEVERAEIARELHDDIGQSLAAISVGAAFVERNAGRARAGALSESARDIRGESERMMRSLKAMLKRLRPHELHGISLGEELRELVAGWQARMPSTVLSLETLPELPRLQEAVALAVYRTLQEALTNVVRHSGASRVGISLACSGAGLSLHVRDNGCGSAEQVRERMGNGLRGMRERALIAGGHLRLLDSDGGGLTVELRLPLAAPAVWADGSAPGLPMTGAIA